MGRYSRDIRKIDPGGILIHWPIDEVGVYKWVLWLAIGYLAVAFFMGRANYERYINPGRNLGERVFDAATFSSSIMLLMGIFDPNIITFLGGTKLFLVIAGLAGSLYSLYALGTK